MKIICSTSGGKDSVAQMLVLAERYGPSLLIAHLQVIPEQWSETLPYIQELCAAIGVPLVAQQIIYEPAGAGTGVRRREIRDIQSPNDLIPLGTPGAIAGVTDLARRRGWPPSPAARFCTAYFKRELLDTWIRQNRVELGKTIIVALGERAAESARRARKVALWPRIRWADGTIAWNWLPVHHASRQDVFRRLKDWSVAPHPAYRYQGLTERQMYDVDEEGGPRCGCRYCIHAASADVCHQAEMAGNRELLEQIVGFERSTGRTWWMTRSAQDLARTWTQTIEP